MTDPFDPLDLAALDDEERALLACDPVTKWLTEPMPGAIHCRPDGGERELWPLLYEKAMAQHMGGSYEDLDGDFVTGRRLFEAPLDVLGLRGQLLLAARARLAAEGDEVGDDVRRLAAADDADVGGRLLVDAAELHLADRLGERHHLLPLTAQAADRDQALGRFLLTHDQHHRHVGQFTLGIAAALALGGIPLVLTDTAGLRASDEPVERIGVERSQALIEAGWSTTGIVVISQLVAFLSYQIRVVAGLRVLKARPA